MKRPLCVLVLLLILVSAYAPFYAGAKPIDSKMVNPDTGEASISKWGGVASLKVKPLDAVTKVDGKLKTAAGVEIKVDERADGFKYSWILASRPDSNVFSLKLDFTGCNFYYQPPLDAGTYPKGWAANATHVFDDKGVLREHRPVDVVGSYAVYGNQRNGIYETGKVAHIYRPLVTDAAGKRAWGVMNIVGDTLTVTVDQSWLDKAAYPVVVDPTFGVTGIGASEYTVTGSNVLYGSQATVPAGAWKIDSISIYVNDAGLNYQIKMGVWANTNGGALYAGTLTPEIAINNAAYAWKTYNYSPDVAFTGGVNVMLGVITPVTVYVRYDNGGTGHEDNPNDFTNPGNFDWTSNTTRLMSFYVTYYGNPSITSSVISDLDDTDNLYTMKKYYTFTTIITDSDGATDLKAISVRGMQGATVRWMVNATSLDGVPAYAIVTSASTIDIDAASCSFTENVNAGTLVLAIRLEWDATPENDCELAVWAQDVGLHTVGWTTVQTDYFDVISRLVTTGPYADTSSVPMGQNLTITGKLFYADNATGNTYSTSSPPDAQITAVHIRDQFGVDWGSNTTTSGAYSVEFNTTNAAVSSLFYIYVDGAPDYADALTADGRYVGVNISTFSGVVIITTISSLLGITDIAAPILSAITTLGGSLTNALSLAVSAVFQVFRMVLFVGNTILYWGTLFITTWISVLTTFGDIMDGSSSITTGLGNIWNMFSFSTWGPQLLPIVGTMMWWDSVIIRSRRQQRGNHEVILGDVQSGLYIAEVIWGWGMNIFNLVWGLVSWFAGIVAGLVP